MEKITASIKEAAEILGVSERTITRMRDDGKLTALDAFDAVKFRLKDVLALAELDPDDVTAFEYRRMKKRLEALEDENSALRETLKAVYMAAAGALIPTKKAATKAAS